MELILFVCQRNASRSLMAEAILNHEAKLRRCPVRAVSAGIRPAEGVDPVAMDVLYEMRVPTDGLHPKLLTSELSSTADKIIGLGEECGAAVTEDWALAEAEGDDYQAASSIRDQIRERVIALIEAQPDPMG